MKYLSIVFALIWASNACFAVELSLQESLTKAVHDTNLASFKAAIVKGAELNVAKLKDDNSKQILRNNMLLPYAIGRRSEIFKNGRGQPGYEVLLNDSMAIVVALLEAGNDPNQRDGNDRPSVYMPVENGDTELVKLLVKRGAKLTDGKRLLDMVLHQPSPAMFELLMTYGIASDLSPDLLKSAARDGNSSMLETLLKAGVSPNAKPTPGENGELYDSPTPLFHAVELGLYENVKLLLKYGANVNATFQTGSHSVGIGKPVKGVEKIETPPDAPLRGKTALLEAVSRHNYYIIDLLLEAGARIGATDERGATELHFAASHSTDAAGAERDAMLMQKLVKMGANVNARTLKRQGNPAPWNQTPLHFAIFSDSDKHVKTLLDLGADINAKDSDGRTALYRAQTGSRPKCVALLRQRGAIESAVNTKINETIAAADFGAPIEKLQDLLKADPSLARAADPDTLTTPLHKAAQEGNLEGIKLLLANEAAVNALDKHGLTPLHVAIHGNRYVCEAIMLLVKGGADVKTIFKRPGMAWPTTPLLSLFEIESNIGSSPKVLEDLVQLFLKHGADVNVEVNHVSPIKRAIDHRNPRLLKLMAEHSGDVAVAGRGGATALMSLARALDSAGMTQLMDRNAELALDSKDDCGRTALHYAVRLDRGWDQNQDQTEDEAPRLKAVQLLAARGANLSLRDKFGWTALDFAEYTQCAKVSAWLKTQKAASSDFSPESLEFLRAVEKRDHTSVDRILTAHPGLIKVWDNSEMPPIFRANFYQNEALMKVLLSHGADPDLSSDSQVGFREKGVTPLIAAAMTGNRQGVALLIEFHADVNKPNVAGFTALNFGRMYPEIAKILNDNGAKLGSRKAPKLGPVKPPAPPDGF